MTIKKIGAAALLFLATTANGESWEAFTEVDEINDVSRVAARLGPIIAWCEPKSGWISAHARVVILTERIPAAQRDDAGGYGRMLEGMGANMMKVPLEYRFDLEKGQRTEAELAEDYQGIALCAGFGRHCSKPFLQRLQAANTLKFRIDTLTGGSEYLEVDLREGREALLPVMDECNVKPKRFKGIGD